MLRISNKIWSHKYAQNQGFIDWKTFLPQAIAENFQYLNHPSGQYSLENATEWKNAIEMEEQVYYKDLVFSNKQGRNDDAPIFEITIELIVFPKGNTNKTPGYAVAEIHGNMISNGRRQGLYNLKDVHSNVRDIIKLKQFPYEIVENASKMIESQDKLNSGIPGMRIQDVLDHKSPPQPPQPPQPPDTGEYGMGGNWWQT